MALLKFRCQFQVVSQDLPRAEGLAGILHFLQFHSSVDSNLVAIMIRVYREVAPQIH